MNKYTRVRTYFLENLGVVIPLLLTGVIYNLMLAYLPTIEGKTIDSITTGDTNEILRLCLIFSGVVLFVQINRFFKRYLVRVFSNRITYRMRDISYRNLLVKEVSYFNTHSTGDILNRNMNDIADTAEGIRKMTTEVFDTFVLLIGYAVVMLTIDPWLTLYGLPFVVLSFLCAHFMKKLVYKRNKEAKEYASIEKEKTLFMLKNSLAYRGYGAEAAYMESYDAVVEVQRKKKTKALLLSGSMEPVYLSIALAGLGVVLYIGSQNVMNGVYTIGTLTAFLSVYALVGRKAGKVGKLFNSYQAFRVSWGRVQDYLLDTEISERKAITAERLILKEYQITYPEFATPVVHLDAHKGEIIGICGRIHTGKSSLLKGLCGLEEYQGSATLNDCDIHSLGNVQYASYLGVDTDIFTGTLRENITLGKEMDAEAAAHMACLSEDSELSNLDRRLTHTNSNISGGQRKRIGAARALGYASAVILLDDPFMSLNEKMAMELMEHLRHYPDSIILLASNQRTILEKTDQIILLSEKEAVTLPYKEMLKNEEFQTLMEVGYEG